MQAAEKKIFSVVFCWAMRGQRNSSQSKRYRYFNMKKEKGDFNYINILDALENESEVPKQNLDVRAELKALETEYFCCRYQSAVKTHLAFNRDMILDIFSKAKDAIPD